MMLTCKQYLNEEKNLHMTHAEDAVIDGGVNGTRNVINYFRALRDMLSGNTKAPVNISVKWDGAPAVFAGKDPRDGKFFVAKKGIFNKNPKVYKTMADVDADTSGDLNVKLKLALSELPKLGIEGVVQGDFLYSRDDIKEDIQIDSKDDFVAKELNNIKGIQDQILTENDLKTIKRIFILEANRLTRNPIQLRNLTDTYYKITKRDLKSDYVKWFYFNRELLNP
jgi:hypothetical protein